jgi:hypothetical protein
MRRLAFALVLLLGSVAWRPATAQEIQVPLDLEGRVDRVDATLARQLGIFVDRFPDLQEVRLFVQLPDSSFVLEITRQQAGQLLRQRESLTAPQVAALRADVSARLAERALSVVDRDGRLELIAASSVVGLGFNGWAVPEVLDVDQTRTAVALYMLTSAASIVVPWIATRNAPVSEAMASLYFYGASRGILHGIAAEWLLFGEDAQDPFEGPRVDRGRRRLGLGLAASALEGIGGYAWARNQRMNQGETSSIANGGDFGMLAGLALAAFIDASDEVDENRLVSGLVLAGAAGGMPLGLHMARRRGYSHGDAHAMRASGALGIFTGLMAVDWTSPSSDAVRPWAAAAMLGGIGGLAVGDWLAQPRNLTSTQGRLVQLATIAGGALGLGTAYLVGSDNGGDDATRYLSLGTLGGAAGFALGYRAVAGDAPRATGSRSNNLRFDLLPRLPQSRGTPGAAGRTNQASPGATLRVEYLLP